MTTAPNNMDDVIDSRDVIARIEHLQQLRQPGPVDLGDDDNETNQDDLFAELAALETLQAEAEQYSEDWPQGATLIRDSYFKDYAQELAEDCGMINSDQSWPNNCIDWDEAARQLEQDYTEIDFDGVAYWVR